MSTPHGREALERFLATSPLDAGCDDVMELLDAYVDLVIAGENPDVRYPGITIHLRNCDPCADDYAGVLALARGTAD